MRDFYGLFMLLIATAALMGIFMVSESEAGNAEFVRNKKFADYTTDVDTTSHHQGVVDRIITTDDVMMGGSRYAPNWLNIIVAKGQDGKFITTFTFDSAIPSSVEEVLMGAKTKILVKPVILKSKDIAIRIPMKSWIGYHKRNGVDVIHYDCEDPGDSYTLLKMYEADAESGHGVIDVWFDWGDTEMPDPKLNPPDATFSMKGFLEAYAYAKN